MSTAAVAAQTAGQMFEEAEPDPVPVKKPTRRGFAKIDVVDVILSDDAYDPNKDGKASIFEKITDTALNKGLSYEPTYRQEPRKRFDSDLVYKILKELVEKELRELSYSEKECQNACKRVAYYIRRAVKQLNFDRYRIICQVRIIEKLNQGVETRTGFVWDAPVDGFSTFSMETQSFAAQAVVYGVYKE